MAITYAKPEEINEISKNLSVIANDYDAEINALFSRLSDVPTVTQEWIGQSAEKYFKAVLLDKSEYVALGAKLHSLCRMLDEEADQIRTTVKKNVTKEQKLIDKLVDGR